MNEYCKKHKIRVVEEFVDPGRTAKNDNRPQFRSMIQLAQEEAADIDLILCYSFTRVFRKLEDQHYYQKILRGNGVRFLAITEEYDEDDPQQMMMATFHGMVAEMYSLENSKHVKRAMRQNARGGFFNGSRPPFGYKTEEIDLPAKTGKKKKLVLNEDEAKIVEEIFDLYEHGLDGKSLGMKAIAKHLNEKDKLRRGTKWRAQSIQVVLSDVVYCGTLWFGGRSLGRAVDPDEDDVVPTPVPSIIEEARFKRLAVRRVERSPRKNPMRHTTPPSLLTGMCRCGYCGCSMSIVTGKGGKYRYLKCNERNVVDNGSCQSPNIPAEAFETMVLETLCEKVLSEEHVARIINDCAANADDLKGKEAQDLEQFRTARGKVQSKISNLLNFIEKNDFDPNDGSFKDRLRSHQDELQALDVKIDDLKVKVLIPKSIFETVSIADFSSGMRRILADRQNPLAKDFLRLFVSEIRVYADEATLTGPNLGLVEAAITQRKGTSGEVPSSMHKWRRERDSNP